MEIYFKLIHPEVSKQLVDRSEKRIAKLGKLIDQGKFEAQAYVEITKVTGSQHSEAAWKTIMNLDARGERFHAESVQSTPEKSADRAIDEMRAELHTYRARERSVNRKANGFWKTLLQNDFKSP